MYNVPLYKLTHAIEDVISVRPSPTRYRGQTECGAFLQSGPAYPLHMWAVVRVLAYDHQYDQTASRTDGVADTSVQIPSCARVGAEGGSCCRI